MDTRRESTSCERANLELFVRNYRQRGDSKQRPNPGFRALCAWRRYSRVRPALKDSHKLERTPKHMNSPTGKSPHCPSWVHTGRSPLPFIWWRIIGILHPSPVFLDFSGTSPVSTHRSSSRKLCERETCHLPRLSKPGPRGSTYCSRTSSRRLDRDDLRTRKGGTSSDLHKTASCSGFWCCRLWNPRLHLQRGRESSSSSRTRMRFSGIFCRESV